MTDLKARHCTACDGAAQRLTPAAARELLAQVAGWEMNPDGSEIRREFRFPDFYQTMSFVNAVAWIANVEDHHPDLEVGYHTCRVRYSTHSVQGLSENDFICAAKVDALLPQPR
ncbi:MAG: 4a-hydroxytetrahydrobiopterin dehydratase [Acidobacteria bacterium]|nr:4a-hydroxytetrahydrobiopterin dehydratase [Acidobacteriota bacterium]